LAQLPNSLPSPDNNYLLITSFGKFWALSFSDPATGVRQSAILFDAITGKRVVDDRIIERLKRTDTTLADLSWIPAGETTPQVDRKQLQEDLQSIVRVPMADHWADYRPARPVDFVGRDKILTEMMSALDRVRNGETHTRIMALKAPSGWG